MSSKKFLTITCLHTISYDERFILSIPRLMLIYLNREVFRVVTHASPWCSGGFAQAVALYSLRSSEATSIEQIEGHATGNDQARSLPEDADPGKQGRREPSA